MCVIVLRLSPLHQTNPLLSPPMASQLNIPSPARRWIVVQRAHGFKRRMGWGGGAKLPNLGGNKAWRIKTRMEQERKMLLKGFGALIGLGRTWQATTIHPMPQAPFGFFVSKPHHEAYQKK